MSFPQSSEFIGGSGGVFTSEIRFWSRRCIAAEPVGGFDEEETLCGRQAADEPYLKEKSFGDCNNGLPYQVTG